MRAKRSTNRLASVAVIAICQTGRPNRRASSAPTHAASTEGNIVVIPRIAWAYKASATCGKPVAGHRPGVAEAEVDVAQAVDVGEVGAAGRVEEDRERPGPPGHPRHRNTTEQVGLGLFGQYRRSWMGGDEALLFFGVPQAKNLSINHESPVLTIESLVDNR